MLSSFKAVQQPDEVRGVPQVPSDVDDYNTEIKMNLRGQFFTITRDDLMALPESILLCLFPNGVFVDINGNVITNLTEDDVVYVNFSPECFQYICQVFDAAVHDLQVSEQNGNHQQVYDINDPGILNDKPSIIVLREDLDYYCIPPVAGLDATSMRKIKLFVGEQLVGNKRIFDGLGYEPGKQLKAAEQHLLDMLCSSGFKIDGEWGHRSLEPGKTVVFSLALVRLLTESPETPADESPSLRPISSVSSLSSQPEKRKSRLSTLAQAVSRSGSRARKEKNSIATKLLLFWRKPARKCWWSDTVLDLDISSLNIRDTQGRPLGQSTIKIHIRRVWTLELLVVGIHDTIKDEFFERHNKYPLIKLNDFYFGAHGLLLNLLLISQAYFWGFKKNDNQKVSIACKLGLTAVLFYAIGYSFIIHNSKGALYWVDLLTSLGLVKILMSVCKNIPQVLYNYNRKSTHGWPIQMVWLDFAGSLFSFAQLALDAYIAGDIRAIFNNLPKLLLSMEVALADFVFFVQHYLLYYQRDVAQYGPFKPLASYGSAIQEDEVFLAEHQHDHDHSRDIDCRFSPVNKDELQRLLP
ncbi:hypothetical protein OGAPHI_004640 [Ogataea philodendri]|uniref:Uncharacterized protein n=1 Tax=Ogataea philodendri TaxID=1378263 RepID=A0A9P8P2D6_9ASCO|nr:uncharacterized protein OGAPHI_004640 [Ogataea philodendri]KAH3664288.1 hypothetical protein OGAPHI_004640 [Ogataea philodendri]